MHICVLVLRKSMGVPPGLRVAPSWGRGGLSNTPHLTPHLTAHKPAEGLRVGTGMGKVQTEQGHGCLALA